MEGKPFRRQLEVRESATGAGVLPDIIITGTNLFPLLVEAGLSWIFSPSLAAAPRSTALERTLGCVWGPWRTVLTDSWAHHPRLKEKMGALMSHMCCPWPGGARRARRAQRAHGRWQRSSERLRRSQWYLLLVETPVLLLPSCGTLSKSLQLAVPQFTHI